MSRQRWKYRPGEEADRFEKVGKMHKRRQAQKAPELKDPFEKPEDEWQIGGEDGAFAARVVEVHKRYAFISPEPVIGEIETRDPRLATVVRKFLTTKRLERNLIVVGDRVLCRPAAETEADIDTDLPCCVIMNMAPRTTKIARPDPSAAEREHVLAANCDQMVVVASYLSPLIKWGLIDRYLILAEEQEIPVIIVLNKEDLLEEEGDEEFIEQCRERGELYQKLGYQVFSISALEHPQAEEIEKIRELLRGKMSLVSGHSGVGKSSLVNLCRPEIVQDVEPDANIFYKGRHTTTYASMIKLGTGGYVVDTPGIRSFLVADRGPIELSYGFVEFRPFAGQCKFRECRHIDEPSCAITAAVERGDISHWRYRSYVGLLLGETGREGRLRDQRGGIVEEP